MRNFYIEGEDFDGNCYSFESNGDLQDVIDECEEYLQSLGGGHFDIYDSATDQFVDYVEW